MRSTFRRETFFTLATHMQGRLQYYLRYALRIFCKLFTYLWFCRIPQSGTNLILRGNVNSTLRDSTSSTLCACGTLSFSRAPPRAQRARPNRRLNKPIG